MTREEALKFFDEQKANGMSEDEILAVLYKMFQDDKIDLDQLEALCAVMGYELTEEFKNMSDEDKKTKGVEQAVEDEEVEEKIEDKVEEKEEEKPESEEKEEFEEKDEEEEESEESEEDEEKKAKKLFGLE